MFSRHLAEYSTLKNNALHTHTQRNGLKPWCGGVPWACSSQYAVPVCDVTIIYTISRMLHVVAAVVMIFLYARWWSWHTCVVSERCRIFPRDQSVNWTQQCGSAEKSGLRDVKSADFIRYWRRSGLKIRINRGLLYKWLLEWWNKKTIVGILPFYCLIAFTKCVFSVFCHYV